MTTVVLSRTNRFQYCSDALLNGEIIAYKGPGEPLSGVILDLIFGFNASASDRYLQIFGGFPAQPAPGTVPAISLPVPAGMPFSLNYGPAGLRSGVSWWVSSTPDTYTESADTFWVNANGRGTDIET